VAASAPSGAMLIVAGPGTGKTHTLTQRIAYVVAELGVAPEKCLAIMFNHRAATELSGRLHKLLPEQATKLNIDTFHSLGLSILREQHTRVGLSADFRIANPGETPDHKLK